MGYIKENEILLNEKLCTELTREELNISIATRRFKDNVKLVGYVAKKFSQPRDNSIDFDDILQEGYLGLWKACLRFDENKEVEFSTYAVPMIRGNILFMLRNTNSMHIPRWFKDISSALIAHGFSLPLSEEEVDILVGEGKFSRYQILEFSNFSVTSMDEPIDSEGDYGSSRDYYMSDPDQEFENKMTEDEIEQLVDLIIVHFKEQYRDMIEEWMYATLEGVKITQSELGKKYGFSQPQVMRILRQATEMVKIHKNEILPLFGI